MSGHNKWSKIKHKKAATDAVKSKLFSKYSKLITQESKKAGGDTESPGLRAAIEKAKTANMPADNIDRAVKKGTGEDASNMEEVVYEAYGVGGVAFVITGLTDNKNRAAQEVKAVLSKNQTELAGSGAALWNFENMNGEWIPGNTIPVSEEEKNKINKLTEELEDLDDIQGVYTTAEQTE